MDLDSITIHKAACSEKTALQPQEVENNGSARSSQGMDLSATSSEVEQVSAEVEKEAQRVENELW